MYRVIDYYKNLVGNIIGETETVGDAIRIAKHHFNKTEGECELAILDENNEDILNYREIRQ